MSRGALGSSAGFVLAGGASSRMGSDKALLDSDGLPLVRRVAEVVRRAAGSCAIVAPAGRYESLDLRVLPDRFPGDGPLGGILTALESSEAAWNLITAVDMPFLEVSFLRAMLAEAFRGGEPVIPAHEDGSLEPLCAVYPTSALGGLQTFFDGGGRSVRRALQGFSLRTVPAPARIVTSVNTPEQWEALR